MHHIYLADPVIIHRHFGSFTLAIVLILPENNVAINIMADIIVCFHLLWIVPQVWNS